MRDIIVIGIGVLNLGVLVYLVLNRKSSGGEGVKRKLEEVEKEIGRLEGRLKDEFRVSREEARNSQRQAREELSKSVDKMQSGNEKKLEQMRVTVDEKLQASVEKRFSESFKAISGQLEQVYKGLGEMQNLAAGVGDLKKVMEGVKTRGIFGEVQLGTLLADILTREQYAENVVTNKGTKDPVEFAIKMPQKDADSVVYLPVDSKFPTASYGKLVAAFEAGDKAGIVAAQKELAVDVKTQAKLISDKYLDPPATTDFGVMFVPTESLFAEIVRVEGLLEEVQQKYRVTIVGPTTLTTLLNSLLLGFRTLAIEKRSSEVWKVLGAVKTQFGKFGDLLAKTREKLEQTTKTIGEAEHRSRQLEKSLKDVESLPERESVKLIGDGE